MESDHRYYSRRAAEEQGRAARAITPEARERHRELATLFANRAAQQLRHEQRQFASG
jgi:CelD/BcsL family acetyltransferase involved in cellulose biosynthesis